MGSIPWWQDPSIRLALATVLVPGLYRILAATGLELPFSQDKFAVVIVDGLMMAGGVIWVVRRVKRGQDPNDPAKPVTLTDKS